MVRALVMIGGALFVLTGCDRITEVTTPAASVTSASGRTGVTAVIGGSSGFQFLPPIAPKAAFAGELDGTLSPVVEVCAWRANACVLPLVSRLTDVKVRGADGNDEDDNDDGDDDSGGQPEPYYGVTWRTRGMRLDPAETYRIRVLVAGTELGVADVDVVRNAREKKDVDATRFVALIAGENLRIRFRIAKGAVWVVGGAGGSISAFGGRVQLDVPAGALTRDVGITVARETGAPSANDAVVVPGSAYRFGPEGLAFAKPVRLTVGYDQAAIPAGKVESLLRLQKLVNGAWQVVQDATVNPAANTVSGSLNGFSVYGAVTTSPSGQLLLTGWGTATVDGSLAAGEWEFAGRKNFYVHTGVTDSVPATIYVMNDADNIYMAVKYADAVSRNGVRFGIAFDADDDGLDEPGEDRVVGGIESGSQKFQDQVSSPDCGSDKCSDAQKGGTNDGTSSLLYAGSGYILEVSHPLASGDPNDLFVLAGSIIGFNFGLFIFDEPPDNNGYLSQFPGTTPFARVLIQQAPIPTLTGVGAAALDGVMDELEWRNAACVFFRADVPGGGDTPAKWCVMNDAVNLYIGVSYARTAIDASAIVRLQLDKDGNGKIDNGDDFFQYEGMSGAFADGYWLGGGQPNCPAASVMCEFYDTAPPGAAGAFAQSASHATFEIRRPLGSTDPFDMNLSAGSQAGSVLLISLMDSLGQLALTYVPIYGVTPIRIQ